MDTRPLWQWLFLRARNRDLVFYFYGRKDLENFREKL